MMESNFRITVKQKNNFVGAIEFVVASEVTVVQADVRRLILT